MQRKKVDPLKPGADIKIMRAIIAQHENQKKPKISKIRKKEISYFVDDQPIDLTHGLIKFGDQYWIFDFIPDNERELYTGSPGTKVKPLPGIYEKNSSGDYVFKSIPANQDVIKVIELPEQRDWINFVKAANQEYQMLKQAGDQRAAIFIDEEKQKIYIKQSKAPGVRLLEYLQNNNLSLLERFKLKCLVHQAVQRLHNKGICHFDLKLENIFYDPKTDKITIVDFGSSMENTPKKLGNRKDYNFLLQKTTTEFEPPNKNENTAAQVDAYSLAGVDALIFSEVPKENWVLHPLFKSKNPNSGNGPYDFDSLLNPIPPYIKSPEDKEFMQYILQGLRFLGHENEDKRWDLETYQNYLARLPSIVKNSDMQKQIINILSNTYTPSAVQIADLDLPGLNTILLPSPNDNLFGYLRNCVFLLKKDYASMGHSKHAKDINQLAELVESATTADEILKAIETAYLKEEEPLTNPRFPFSAKNPNALVDKLNKATDDHHYSRMLGMMLQVAYSKKKPINKVNTDSIQKIEPQETDLGTYDKYIPALIENILDYKDKAAPLEPFFSPTQIYRFYKYNEELNVKMVKKIWPQLVSEFQMTDEMIKKMINQPTILSQNKELQKIETKLKEIKSACELLRSLNPKLEITQ